MNTMEDKVRLALRETGEEIGPHSVPPLRLPGTRRTRLPRIPGRWGTWLTPLAAAAAVAAVVAASLAISTTFHGHTRSTGQTTAPRWNGSPVGPPSALRKVPPYFVALSGHRPSRGPTTGRWCGPPSPAARSPRSPRPARTGSSPGSAAPTTTARSCWPPSATGISATARPGCPRRTGQHHAHCVLQADLRPGHPRGHADQAHRPGDHPFLVRDGRVTRRHQARPGPEPQVRPGRHAGHRRGPVLDLAWHRRQWIGNWKPMGQVFSWSADGRYLEFQQWGGHFDETMRVRILDTTAPGTSLTAAKVIVAFPLLGRHPRHHATRSSPRTAPRSSPRPASTRRITPALAATSRSPSTPPAPASPCSTRTGSAPRSAGRTSSGPARTAVRWSSAIRGAQRTSTAAGPTSWASLPGNKFTPIPHGAYNGLFFAW